MRAIVLLILGVVVVALALKLQGRESWFGDGSFGAETKVLEQEPDDGLAGSFAQAPEAFATPAQPNSVPLEAVVPKSQPRADDLRAQSADVQAPASNSSTLRAGVQVVSASLAANLLHAGPQQFAAALDAEGRHLAAERQRLLMAFSEAMVGQVQRALDLAGDLQPGEMVPSDEFMLLQEALGGERGTPLEASMAGRAHTVRAMWISLRARDAQRALEERQWESAAGTFSEVILAELNAPWSSDQNLLAHWGSGLNEAQANHRWSPNGSWPGQSVTVRSGDSLSLIRSRFVKEHPDTLLCTGMIARINALEGPYLHAGVQLRIPTERVSMLVDLEARMAFYMFGDEIAQAWVVGIGAPESSTRPGEYVVGELTKNPIWFRQGKAPVPFGDPENELGTRWIGWNLPSGAGSHLGFHGTWEPEGVGSAVSDGCIRMVNSDVEELFKILPRGARILVQP